MGESRAPLPFSIPPVATETPQDKVRKYIAYILLAILAGNLFLAWLAGVSGRASWSEVKDYIVATQPALVALVGAATGFYYGTKAQ